MSESKVIIPHVQLMSNIHKKTPVDRHGHEVADSQVFSKVLWIDMDA
jgi:hypothetical protein